MLLPWPGVRLVLEYLELLSNSSSSVARFDDLIDKSTLSCPQWISESSLITIGLLLHVLSPEDNLNCPLCSHNSNFGSWPSQVHITEEERKIGIFQIQKKEAQEWSVTHALKCFELMTS